MKKIFIVSLILLCNYSLFSRASQIEMDVPGNLIISDIPTSVKISTSSLPGTATPSQYLRGDGTWSTPSGGSNVIISSSVKYATTIKNYGNTAFSTSTLNLSLVADTTYQFTFWALMQTSATAVGILPTLNYDVAPIRIYWSGDAPLTATTGGHIYGNSKYQGIAFATGLTAMTNNIKIMGSIITGSSATVLQFMFRSEVSDGYCQFQEGTASAIPTP